MSTTSATLERPQGVSEAGEDQRGGATDEKVVHDLVKYLLDPSSKRAHSSTRALISPDLTIDFPFLHHPPPSSASPSVRALARSPSSSNTSTLQALSLFRLPALCVNLLPGVEWTATVKRVNKADWAVEPSQTGFNVLHEPVSTVSTSSLSETWTAEVRWTLSIGGAGAGQSTSSSSRSHRTNDDGAVLHTLKSKTHTWRRRSAPRVVELVFAPKPLDAATQQKKLEREQQVSSDVDVGQASEESEWTVVSHKRSPKGKTRQLEIPSSAGGAKVTEDEPLQPLQLVYVRYRLPPPADSASSSIVRFVPGIVKSATVNLAVTLLVWVLPLIHALLVFLGLDSAHVLAEKPLHRRAAIYERRKREAKQEKSKEQERSGTKSKPSRRKSLSSSSTSSTPSTGVLSSTSALDPVSPAEEDAMARLAALSSEEDPEHPYEYGRSSHPRHVGHSRRWSTSTSSSAGGGGGGRFRNRDAEEEEDDEHPATALEIVKSTLSTAAGSAADASHSAWEGATSVVSEAKDVAWTIRRGVVFATQLVGAAVDVGRGVLGGGGGGSDDDEGREGRSARRSQSGRGAGGTKRRYSAREAGLRLEMELAAGEGGEGESKKQKHVEGEDVGGYAVSSPEEEKGRSPSSPTSPTKGLGGQSPPKSAMSAGTNGKPHLKKRVSFSASSDLIPRLDTPAPQVPPQSVSAPPTSPAREVKPTKLFGAGSTPSSAQTGEKEKKDGAKEEDEHDPALKASHDRAISAAVSEARSREGSLADAYSPTHGVPPLPAGADIEAHQAAAKDAALAASLGMDAKAVERQREERLREAEWMGRERREASEGETEREKEQEAKALERVMERKKNEAEYQEREYRSHLDAAASSSSTAATEGDDSTKPASPTQRRSRPPIAGGGTASSLSAVEAEAARIKAAAAAERALKPGMVDLPGPPPQHPHYPRRDLGSAQAQAQELHVPSPVPAHLAEGSLAGGSTATSSAGASRTVSPFSGLAGLAGTAYGVGGAAGETVGRRDEGMGEGGRSFKEMWMRREGERDGEGEKTPTPPSRPSSTSEEHPGSTLSAPSGANTSSKLAFRSMLDSTGVGRPTISAPRRMGIEQVPTPVSRHERRESEEERRERTRVLGGLIGASSTGAEEGEEGSESHPRPAGSSEGGSGAGTAGEKTPTAASFAEVLKHGGEEEVKTPERGEEREADSLTTTASGSTAFHTPPTQPSALPSSSSSPLAEKKQTQKQQSQQHQLPTGLVAATAELPSPGGEFPPLPVEASSSSAGGAGSSLGLTPAETAAAAQTGARDDEGDPWGMWAPAAAHGHAQAQAPEASGSGASPGGKKKHKKKRSKKGKGGGGGAVPLLSPLNPPTILQTRRSFNHLSTGSGRPSSSTSSSPPSLHIDVQAVNSSSPSPSLSGSGKPAHKRAMSDPNAQTTEETRAEGVETYGKLNQHPAPEADDGGDRALGFKVGVSVDRNKKCRRTMEDAHSFIYDFGGIRGQGYFAIFDGHAGKHAAEWCGEHFHEHLLDNLRKAPATPVPDLLNSTFHLVDTKLSELAASENTHSGCTAAVVFLRLEDGQGNAVGDAAGVSQAAGVEVQQGPPLGDAEGALKAANAGGTAQINEDTVAGFSALKRDGDAAGTGSAGLGELSNDATKEGSGGGASAKDVKSRIKSMLTGSNKSSEFTGDAPPLSAASSTSSGGSSVKTPDVEISGPAEVKKAAKRTLYTANVGDARAVLSRGGRAVRLTYDHKGSDAKEAKRISDAGGFVLNNRVNGVLAVTRSLGDSSMKEFVTGSPYTTETSIGPGDEWLIVACDGLWDVCGDQEAVDIIKDCQDPQEASQKLLDHALANFSTDNLSVLCVKLQH
ncbi:hypothetical protein JCM8097_006684 [Rhodosporidiobolus ruineniae]